MIKLYMAAEWFSWGSGHYALVVADQIGRWLGVDSLPEVAHRMLLLPAHLMWAYRQHFIG